MQVCAELFSTGEASSGSGFSNMQANNCSFGRFVFEKKPTSKPTFPKEPSNVPREKFQAGKSISQRRGEIHRETPKYLFITIVIFTSAMYTLEFN